jgi:hypothetical protein
VEQPLASLTLHDSEVYLNHALRAPRTVLLGCKYKDAQSGKTWTQDRAGWYKPVSKGLLFYFQPGRQRRGLRKPGLCQGAGECG